MPRCRWIRWRADKPVRKKIRVYVAAVHRMLRETLGLLLVKRVNVEVVGFDATLTCDAGGLVDRARKSCCWRLGQRSRGPCRDPANARGSSQRADFAYGVLEGRG